VCLAWTTLTAWIRPRVEIEARQLDLISRALEKVMDVLALDDDQRELATSTLLLELEEPDIQLEEEEA
jgi:hypothetical protein